MIQMQVKIMKFSCIKCKKSWDDEEGDDVDVNVLCTICKSDIDQEKIDMKKEIKRIFEKLDNKEKAKGGI